MIGAISPKFVVTLTFLNNLSQERNMGSLGTKLSRRNWQEMGTCNSYGMNSSRRCKVDDVCNISPDDPILLFFICGHTTQESSVSEKYLLNLIQPNRKTSLLKRLFPPFSPIAAISLPSTPLLTCLLFLLLFRQDLSIFPEKTIKGYPQLFNFIGELELWLDLIGDGTKDRIGWRVLEEGK